MRMADNRSLLALLTGFGSGLLLLLCPIRYDGAAGGGSGGGGGTGGGGTGGREYPGATCKSPLCGTGGSAPRRKPKSVWGDGMDGPGVGIGGGLDLLDRERKRIMSQM